VRGKIIKLSSFGVIKASFRGLFKIKIKGLLAAAPGSFALFKGGSFLDI